jgi:hypothetical protein
LLSTGARGAVCTGLVMPTIPGIPAIVGIAHAYPLSTKTSWSRNNAAKVANQRRRRGEGTPNTNAGVARQ